MGVVMIVDSAGDVAREVVDAISAQGRTHTTIERKSGRSAVSALQEGIPVDVIVADDRLADMDGIELLASVRKIDPNVPLIMSSRNLSVEAYLKAVHAGVYDFIVRPISPPLLRRIMATAMKERGHARFP